MDTLPIADRLAKELQRTFGAEAIYFDRRTEEPRHTWDSDIETAVKGAAVVLVLIGKKWLTEQNKYGCRRQNAVRSRNGSRERGICHSSADGRYATAPERNDLVVKQVADNSRLYFRPGLFRCLCMFPMLALQVLLTGKLFHPAAGDR